MITETKVERTKRKSVAILGAYLGVMIAAAIIFGTQIDKDVLQEAVSNSGPLGAVTYFLVEMVYVTFTPMLNTFILIASGYIFGGHIGFIINFLSTAAGLFLIVFLVRKYGRPLLQKVVSPKYYARFDQIVQRVGPITLLIVYVLPFTPDDELTYIVAAGPIGFKRFILPVLFGTIAKAAYSYIGDLGARGVSIAVGARITMLVVGLIAVGFQEYVVKKSGRSLSSVDL